MTYWRKGTEADDFIEIAMIALGNQESNKCLKDKIVFTNYNSPMQFLRFRKKVLGFESLVKQWKLDVENDKNDAKGHWAKDNFDLTTEEGKTSWRDLFLIEKTNNYLNSYLRWQNGQSGKQQFYHAKDIFYYFKKEENYQ